MIEDSKTSRELFRRVLLDIAPDTELVFKSTWMSAIPYLKNASLVVIDWVLSDGITAGDCGALLLLNRKGIPHFVWTAKTDLVVDADVIQKGDKAGLEAKLLETLWRQPA